MSHLHVDFETISAADIKKGGADLYARHPSTDILCMAFAFDEEPISLIKTGEKLPARVAEHVKAGGVVIAHNAPFELAIWEHVGRRKYKWPKLSPEQIHCTMAMAYAMAMPGSLEMVAPAAGIAHQKDMMGNRIMLQLSQPRDIVDGEVVWWTYADAPEKFERLYAYCKQDILVEREVFKRLMRLSESEREIWQLDHRINQRGVQIDLKAAKVAIEMVAIEKKRLDHEMRKITNEGVATCTATKQLTDWIKFRGVEDVEGVAKADILALLEREGLPADVRKALQLRQEAAKSSIAKLEMMVKGACDDGRVRGTLQYHAAATGRWGGRRIQPQNFPRPSLSQNEIEKIFKILEGV